MVVARSISGWFSALASVIVLRLHVLVGSVSVAFHKTKSLVLFTLCVRVIYCCNVYVLSLEGSIAHEDGIQMEVSALHIHNTGSPLPSLQYLVSGLIFSLSHPQDDEQEHQHDDQQPGSPSQHKLLLSDTYKESYNDLSKKYNVYSW